MDDFSGKFCNNGSFPVIRAASDCLKQKKTTTPSPTMTTMNAFNSEIDYLNSNIDDSSYENTDHNNNNFYINDDDNEFDGIYYDSYELNTAPSYKSQNNCFYAVTFIIFFKFIF
jgi:hypothetical protein